MDGIHDLGGKQGFGGIDYELDEPVFHARWEARVFGIYLQRLGGASNIDRRRHAIERIDPRAYLTQGYYGRWLGALETLLIEAGLLSRTEIDTRARRLGAGIDDLVAARPAPQPDIIAYESELEDGIRPIRRRPCFAVGDAVITDTHGVAGHTRLPAYARGRLGRVVMLHGGWVFPDSNAHGQGENPQHLYTVAFDGAELWGRESEHGVTVHLDLFEPYLKAVPEAIDD
jgi:nitrile hydratase